MVRDEDLESGRIRKTRFYSSPIATVGKERRNGSAHMKRWNRFKQALGGVLLALISLAGHATDTTVWESKVYYLQNDHLGTPKAVTDSSDRVVWRNEGEPFGNTLPDEDPDGDGKAFTLNLRFPGQYYDQETQRNQNFFRDYNPETGRYIQSDPIGLRAGPNTFAYVESNPVSYVDPYGLIRITCDPFSGCTPAYEIDKVAHDKQCISISRAAGPATGAAGGQRAGKSFTQAGKNVVKSANAEINGGQTTCVGCGRPTIPAKQSQSGVTPPGNETHVDHIIPKSKGGDGSPNNGQVLCRDCNLRKSNN